MYRGGCTIVPLLEHIIKCPALHKIYVERHEYVKNALQYTSNNRLQIQLLSSSLLFSHFFDQNIAFDADSANPLLFGFVVVDGNVRIDEDRPRFSNLSVGMRSLFGVVETNFSVEHDSLADFSGDCAVGNMGDSPSKFLQNLRLQKPVNSSVQKTSF